MEHIHENQEHCGHGHCSCGHEHHHEHEDESLKPKIVKIVITVLLLCAAVFIEKRFALPTWQTLLVYLVPYLLIGFDTLKEAVEGISEGEVFNENFLMSVATIGALCIGFLPGAETQFPEAVFVMLFFQIGELFEEFAEGKSRQSIAHLMDIRPDTAVVLRNGIETKVSPEEVETGETIIVRPGEKIPIDGIVIEGETALNTSALTGESLPRNAKAGDEVASGCLNITGLVKIKTTKEFGESTVSKIIELVENANEHKSKSEAFITKFARIYTPIVVIGAIVLAVLPPLLSGDFMASFPTWLYRSLMFLIVSCPCALVISVPLSFFGGIGAASRKGVLVKGANYMDTIANLKTVVFDKTGTLTYGKFAVEAVHPDSIDENQILHLAAHVEHFSTHPIGAALRDAFPNEATDGCTVSDVREISGQGICAKVENDVVAVGNSKLMESVGSKWEECECHGTIIHVAVNGKYAGHIVINDTIKEDSLAAVGKLKELGVTHTVMLTGDGEETAARVAEKVSIDDFHAELMPADKVAVVESLLSKSDMGKVAFVGDGINDAPVLARADVGIAMGGLGSDAAIEAADVVIMDDKPSKISDVIRISRRTISIARQNVCFAIAVKVAVLVLAALGVANLWFAVFADVGVTVIAVFSAMRTMLPPRD